MKIQVCMTLFTLFFPNPPFFSQILQRSPSTFSPKSFKTKKLGYDLSKLVNIIFLPLNAIREIRRQFLEKLGMTKLYEVEGGSNSLIIGASTWRLRRCRESTFQRFHHFRRKIFRTLFWLSLLMSLDVFISCELVYLNMIPWFYPLTFCIIWNGFTKDKTKMFRFIYFHFYIFRRIKEMSLNGSRRKDIYFKVIYTCFNFYMICIHYFIVIKRILWKSPNGQRILYGYDGWLPPYQRSTALWFEKAALLTCFLRSVGTRVRWVWEFFSI